MKKVFSLSFCHWVVKTIILHYFCTDIFKKSCSLFSVNWFVERSKYAALKDSELTLANLYASKSSTKTLLPIIKTSNFSFQIIKLKIMFYKSFF